MNYIEHAIPSRTRRRRWIALATGLAALSTIAPVTLAYPDDPVPMLDFGESEKSVVVQLTFHDTLEAELEFVEVVPGPSHGWAGDPSILHVNLLDLESNVVRAFNAWHPLWVNYEDDAGADHGATLDQAVGDYPFPFLPNVATMQVVLAESQQEIIAVDVVPRLHDFCRNNPADPDCDGIVNRAPVCDVNGPYSAECAGPTTSVTLDGSGSDDPDGDAIEFVWSGGFVGETANGAMPTVEFPGFGSFTVDLVLSEDFGGISTCSADVDIVDSTPPVVQCNAPATIVPPDAPIAFAATAVDVCVGEVMPQIVEFDCYALTNSGRRIDKTESCRIDVTGDTITVLDSGGVGDTISWTVLATDTVGNPTTTECVVQVIRPGTD